jgi:uncharacterized membrane protein/YHS domain-containing protein
MSLGEFVAALFETIGRLHPMVLHLPIGMVAALVVLEVVGLVRGVPMHRDLRSALLVVVVLASVLAALSGFVLRAYEGHAGAGVDRHQWLGLGFTACVVVAAYLHRRGRTVGYAALLAASAVLLVPTGHLGGGLVHGERFLTEPWTRAPGDAPSIPAGETVETVADAGASELEPQHPLLVQYCIGCHGPDRTRGGLRLDTREAILAGGDSGEGGFAPLLVRMRLPLDHDDRMPPSTKPQPDADAIEAFAAWVEAGGTGQPAAVASSPERASPPPPLDAGAEDAIARLRARWIHVAPIAEDSQLVAIEVAAEAERFGDEDAVRLLAPLSERIASLTLARTAIGDKTLELAGSMPRLASLDVSGTAVSDAGIEKLRGHPSLATLIATRTAIGDASLDALASMPALERVYLWKTNATKEGAAQLEATRSSLDVDRGDAPVATALTDDGTQAASAPPPPARPTPVNSICPVAGAPIDPSIGLLYEGRIVGFCCTKCLRTFLDDPKAYAAKLR